MRVYYVGAGLQGCYYYRCLLPMQENGWDGDQTTTILDNAMRTPEDKARAAQSADVLVFHRPDDVKKLELARLLKVSGKKIVYDNDDTYKDDNGFKLNAFMDEQRMNRKMSTANEVLDAFITEADLVTCSTEFLAEEYRKLNKNVVVLPNCIDPFMFDEPLCNESDTFRVGFTGSVGCTADFALASDLVKRVSDVRWVMYSLPPDDGSEIYKKLYSDEYRILAGLDIEWHAFTPFEHYYEELNSLRLDVMVIPRRDTYFNKCKSNIKFIEASMFEIPVIAQGFADGTSPYQVDADDAKHMIIAHTQEEFVDAIYTLKNNRALAIEMGKKAKEYVIKKYDINTNAYLWEKTYKSLYQPIH